MSTKEEKSEDEISAYLRGLGNRLALLLLQSEHYPSKRDAAERIIEVLVSERAKNHSPAKKS
jgi:hypothetical protein